MAHFYGSIQGNRGEATRCGTAGSGFQAVAASWQGAVYTTLEYDEKSDSDWAYVRLNPWRGAGTVMDLYRGPVNGNYRVGNGFISTIAKELAVRQTVNDLVALLKRGALIPPEVKQAEELMAKLEYFRY